MATSLSADLVVLGAGPGGYAAAFRAADLGLTVILVDRGPRLGGVCLHHGCIPSKALLHAGHLIHQTQAAAAYGLHFAAPRIDTAALEGWKQGIITDLADGIDTLAARRRVQVVLGRAHFLDPHQLEVHGQQTTVVHFQHAIIATGSRGVQVRDWRLPSGRVMDSYDALHIDPLPPRLLVIGGGYIGLELGEVYAALGSQVHVVELGEGILPGADRDLAEVLERHLRRRFVELRLETKVLALRDEHDGVAAEFSGPISDPGLRFDRVLVAIGRRPNSDGLGLEALGVDCDAQGFIVTDHQRRSSCASIFAIGDVAGPPLLAHKAAYEGKIAAEAITGAAAADDIQAVPAVVYTDPEVAWCGLSETAARAQGLTVACARFPWAASGRARTLGADDGLTKLVYEPTSRRLLGVGIVGAGAGDLIAEAVVACEMGASLEDLARSVHPHPTLSETLAGAAEAGLGAATDLPPTA